MKLLKINKFKWMLFNKIKGLVNSKLEEIRNNKVINKNNEAIITISFNNKHFTTQELTNFLNVARVEINTVSSKKIHIDAKNGNLTKCERC
jgi:hypothetical protein